MQKTQKGFTLIELLVVIAITAIMAVIALPNMSQWLASRRAANQADQIANLLRFARSESARLNLPVYICPVQIKKDGKPNNRCNSQYAEQGLFAFGDKNLNSSYNDDKNDVSLRAISFNANGSAKRTSITYQAASLSGKAAASNDVFWLFLPNGTFGHTSKITSNTFNTADFNMSDGYLKIIVTDAAAQDEASKKARASIVIIDPSGRAEVCSKTDKRTICAY